MCSYRSAFERMIIYIIVSYCIKTQTFKTWLCSWKPRPRLEKSPDEENLEACCCTGLDVYVVQVKQTSGWRTWKEPTSSASSSWLTRLTCASWRTPSRSAVRCCWRTSMKTLTQSSSQYCRSWLSNSRFTSAVNQHIDVYCDSVRLGQGSGWFCCLLLISAVAVYLFSIDLWSSGLCYASCFCSYWMSIVRNRVCSDYKILHVNVTKINH